MVIRRSLSWRSLPVSARTYVRSDCNEFLISATSGQAGQDAVDAAGQFNCQYQNVFCVCVCGKPVKMSLLSETVPAKDSCTS